MDLPSSGNHIRAAISEYGHPAGTYALEKLKIEFLDLENIGKAILLIFLSPFTVKLDVFLVLAAILAAILENDYLASTYAFVKHKIEFLDPENIGIAVLFIFLSPFTVKLEVFLFSAAILAAILEKWH